MAFGLRQQKGRSKVNRCLMAERFEKVVLVAAKKTSTQKDDAKPVDAPEAEKQTTANAADDIEAPSDKQVDTPDQDLDESELTSEMQEASPEPPTEDLPSDEGWTDATDIADPENDVQTEPTETTPPAVDRIVERKGGFVPMVLGGAIAAGIGFGASHFDLFSLGAGDSAELVQQINARLDDKDTQIAALREQLAQLPPAPDVSGLQATQGELAALLSDLDLRLEDTQADLSALDVRLNDVEKRPLTEGASDAAVAAYERELKALQDAMAAQRAEIEDMAATAATMEQSAEETAQATMRRAALTRVQTALDAGTGFASALADLKATGVTVPAELSAVADSGAPSLAELQDAFPVAARAALSASRQALAEQGEGGGFGAFLKTQLGARSLEPQEGNDPDAVLSRVEAAIKDGRLTDALAEIEALPEAGQAHLTDWAAQAMTRLNAVAAAETLGQELN